MSSLTKKFLVGGAVVVLGFLLVYFAGPLTEGGGEQEKQGLKSEDLKFGTGPEAKTGDKVKVHYTGTLKDGTKFDSSLDKGVPLTFEIGAGEVIKGWDMGVPGMKVGGKRKLVIPAELAYGSQARGKIPANSELTFEIELLEIMK
jgi:FKBP-type peptidyl-prolyl cis-trans isomerase